MKVWTVLRVGLEKSLWQQVRGYGRGIGVLVVSGLLTWQASQRGQL